LITEWGNIWLRVFCVLILAFQVSTLFIKYSFSIEEDKLIRLGLLENRVEDIDKGNVLSQIREITVITDFGRRFLIFFSMEDTPEEQV